jgi:hypothetical protein
MFCHFNLSVILVIIIGLFGLLWEMRTDPTMQMPRSYCTTLRKTIMKQAM